MALVSRRRTIVDAIRTVLETIRKDAGYETDVGATVRFANEDVAVLVEQEGIVVAPIAFTRAGREAQEWATPELTVTLFVTVRRPFRSAAMGDFHVVDPALTDVERALMADERLGLGEEFVDTLRINTVRIEPQVTDQSRVVASVALEIQYRHRYDDPRLAVDEVAP